MVMDPVPAHASPRQTDFPGKTTVAPAAKANKDSLEIAFSKPPESARPWVYWWWMNGYATEDGIVRDLNAMKRQGISGALVFTAGQGPTPKTISFMSREWRALFSFAVKEAAKRDIEVSLNLCSGWDAGGPWIEASEAPQQLVFTKVNVEGPSAYSGSLAEPRHDDTYYRDICVMAYQVESSTHPGSVTKNHTRICVKDSAVDISNAMAPDGKVSWQVPAGRWLIVRFGHTVLMPAEASHTKYCAPSDQGYEIDPLRADVMDKHFAATAEKVIPDVRPYVGMDKTLRYFHIDSWELLKPNWTSSFREQFRRLRGYDPFPYMAVLADETVDSHETTARFMEDFNATLGDLTVLNYYGRLSELSHKHNVGTHSEAEGPELFCVDSLKSLGTQDIMMSEYWSRLTEPDGVAYYAGKSAQRFLDGIKGASSAAHIYGRKIVQAEAFTELGSLPYSHYPFALKDLGDRAFCSGLNRNVISFFQHQPGGEGLPGSAPSYQSASIGFKLSRNVTWWNLSQDWLLYLTRCQFMFQQGCPVVDVCYFYGEEVPNFVPAKDFMVPTLPHGFDCDSINAEALLGRMSVEDGLLSLPGGIHYRLLVMPQKQWVMHKLAFFSGFFNEYPGPGNGLPVGMSAAVLKKIKGLVESGATILGDKPVRAPGLAGYPHADKDVQRLADEIWGQETRTSGVRTVGKGRVIWGKQLQDVFVADGVLPDFNFRSNQQFTDIPYIHYRIHGAEVYFLSNQRLRNETVECRFRVTGMQPELWDAVTGEIRDLPVFESDGKQTVVPLKFAPRQSFFILFRRPASGSRSLHRPERNFPRIRTLKEIHGPWDVSFDPKWGGPERVTFETLTDWTERPEDGIRYYSGTATYRKSFAAPDAVKYEQLFLDLGVVNYLAAVRINGKDLGVLWTAPWRVEITHAVKSGSNLLEIDVVNLWPNRLIGDRKLPPEKRFTETNLIVKPGWELLPSGLLGPVTLQITSAASMER